MHFVLSKIFMNGLNSILVIVIIVFYIMFCAGSTTIT